MNVLVLGGSRQIGLHLVRLLHSQGHTVTVLNRGQTQVSLPIDVNKIVADRSVAEQVKTVLDGREYDTVFDISGYRPSEIEPVLDVLEGNVRHYVFCSTVAVYSPKIGAMPILEDSPLNRYSNADDYSREKILCEDLLLERFIRSGFPVSIIRPPYVYGPRDQEVQRLFSIFSKLSLGRKLIAPGEGNALTHSVHVNDLVTAFTTIPGRAEALGEVFTVAGLEAVTFNGYIDLFDAGPTLHAKDHQIKTFNNTKNYHISDIKLEDWFFPFVLDSFKFLKSFLLFFPNSISHSSRHLFLYFVSFIL